jgi:hypothetical protein
MIHVGVENGFVKNALLHGKPEVALETITARLISKIMKKWLLERSNPYLQQNSDVVIHNASYHNVLLSEDVVRTVESWT